MPAKPGSGLNITIKTIIQKTTSSFESQGTGSRELPKQEPQKAQHEMHYFC